MSTYPTQLGSREVAGTAIQPGDPWPQSPGSRVPPPFGDPRVLKKSIAKSPVPGAGPTSEWSWASSILLPQMPTVAGGILGSGLGQQSLDLPQPQPTLEFSRLVHAFYSVFTSSFQPPRWFFHRFLKLK